MKTNRNELCPCGSGNKYKNCCEQKRFQQDGKKEYIRWFIYGAVGCFLVLILWAFVESFSTDSPEMEAYKCDNPLCNRIHYRQLRQPN